MNEIPMVGRISSAVKWKVYEDGVVVLVPATCETHVLSTSLSPLFDADTTAIFDTHDSEHPSIGTAAEGGTAMALHLPGHVFRQLASLRILEIAP